MSRVKDVYIDKVLFKCPICGEEFIAWDRKHWSYRMYDSNSMYKLVCSYHCARQAEKDREKRVRKYGKKK